LQQLPQAIRFSQEELAERLVVGQPAIAKMERRSDLRIQSLRRMIEARGGKLEIKAHFPQGDVIISNFAETNE
jgi:transcriptional regulator with XRE-family HTH domain